MNDFIYSEMRWTSSGLGGAFEVLASFTLDNIPSRFNDVTVKIDTSLRKDRRPVNGGRGFI